MEPAAPLGHSSKPERSSGPLLDRLFEVTSILPLGGFALLHLLAYGRTLIGATELGSRHPPSGWALAGEALGVWLPLVFHALFGAVVWRRRAREAHVEGSERALSVLHRSTGALVLVFLLDHFARFRWPILSGERYPAESLQALARELSRTTAGFPLVASFHVLGTLALSFHLAYGVLRIAERRLPRARPGRLRALAVSLGTLAAALGTVTLIRLATG